MKLLLIKPPPGEKTITSIHVSLCEPLGLEIIASTLKEHEIRLLDMRLEPYSILEETINNYQPDVVGISIDTIEVNQARRIIRKIKELDPRIKVVVGGNHPTYKPEDFFSPYIDVIVLGEGISSFREVIASFEHKKELKNIPNIAFKQEDTLYFTSPLKEEQSIRYPTPRRDLIKRYRNNYYYAWVKPVSLVQATKGSPHKSILGPILLKSRDFEAIRPVEQVAAEIAELENGIVFVDDDPLQDAPYLSELCFLLKQSAIKRPLYLCSTPESVTNSPELLHDLKDIGLISMALKFDTEYFLLNNEPRIIEKRASKIITSNDIFLTGEIPIYHWFTRDDFKKVRELVTTLYIDFPVFLVDTPLPGTELYQKHQRELSSPNWDLFDRMHVVLPTKLPLEEFYYNLAQLYKDFYSKLKLIQLLGKAPFFSLIKLNKTINSFIKRVEEGYKDH